MRSPSTPPENQYVIKRPYLAGAERTSLIDNTICVKQNERLYNGNHRGRVGYRGISAHLHLQQDST